MIELGKGYPPIKRLSDKVLRTVFAHLADEVQDDLRDRLFPKPRVMMTTGHHRVGYSSYTLIDLEQDACVASDRGVRLNWGEVGL